MKIYTPEEEPDRIGTDEAYRRFDALIAEKPEVKLAEGTWRERVERDEPPKRRAR